ncbi:hypothetical protein ANN_09272 [Periplaneta americana]|uniref:Uncharacterized protein n=1 Tax=Periplaneta americana TaxID=6978 RepID=A0ABQ8TKX4_PERAM|nr:hypothetical protein ANN_09272 [Periplaneta americana]
MGVERKRVVLVQKEQLIERFGKTETLSHIESEYEIGVTAVGDFKKDKLYKSSKLSPVRFQNSSRHGATQRFSHCLAKPTENSANTEVPSAPTRAIKLSCETWTLTLREKERLRLFENKVLRKIFGAKRGEITEEWRKLHNTELQALYSSPDIIRNIKCRRLRWAGHVARMGESRNANRVLVGRPEGKIPLGRPIRRCRAIDVAHSADSLACRFRAELGLGLDAPFGLIDCFLPRFSPAVGLMLDGLWRVLGLTSFHSRLV